MKPFLDGIITVSLVGAVLLMNVSYATADESSNSPSPTISSGSGFFVTTDGYFVTNYHVIDGADEVLLIDVNSKTHPATIVRVDTANDIAVLKANGKFKAIPVVSSRTAKRGQSVVTVGYPHADIQGVEPKVTGGIINSLSGLGNDVRTFQISVPLQSGNSGGPLVTLDGNVVGVVAMKLSALAVFKETGDLPQNVNYAVKSNYLSEVLLGIPGLERKLLPPSRRKYKDVADLTAAIEDATALVLAIGGEEENQESRSLPPAQAQIQVQPRSAETVPQVPSSRDHNAVTIIDAIQKGRFENIRGRIMAPDIAENGAVIPVQVDLDSPLKKNECLYLFVNEQYLSHKGCPTGNATLSMISTRVRMPSTGSLRAVITDNAGRIKSFAKKVEVKVGASPFMQNSTTEELSLRVKAEKEGGQVHIRILVNSPMTTANYVDRVTYQIGSGDSIDLTLTPWASSNPYVGVKVSSPYGVTSYELRLTTSLGENRSFQGGF